MKSGCPFLEIVLNNNDRRFYFIFLNNVDVYPIKGIILIRIAY